MVKSRCLTVLSFVGMGLIGIYYGCFRILDSLTCLTDTTRNESQDSIGFGRVCLSNSDWIFRSPVTLIFCMRTSLSSYLLKPKCQLSFGVDPL